MLSSFSITNFKSYRHATLKLAPLTVLIGANAAGKSNVVEGLRLLSWIAAGNRLASIRNALREKEHAIRGNVSDLGFRPDVPSPSPAVQTRRIGTTTRSSWKCGTTTNCTSPTSG